jgi:3-hydroxybutyryl-CoA dehydratase
MSVGEVKELQREIDRWRPIYYAAVSGDFNPIHVDPEFGALAGHGGTILHGLCTLSFATEAAISLFCGGDPSRLASIAVRFSKPVKPEDVVTFRFTIEEESQEGLQASLLATNQRGEEVLKNATIRVRP